MARPDFRSQAAQRLAAERPELSPAIIDLLRPEGRGGTTDVRRVSVDRIEPNPDQPRLTFDEEALRDLAASITEHGILQPVLVRPRGEGRYQLIAGERRWRAARIAGLEQIPAIIEDIDDEAALEISIIENLQREDLSPLDEAVMFERMTSQHGYSLRKLAQKLGKDKGYIENRLRLADAPPEIKELVSLRRDTLSHAYELLKVESPRRRRQLAEQVARGELSLVKLRERIEGRHHQPVADVAGADLDVDATGKAPAAESATLPDEGPAEEDGETGGATWVAVPVVVEEPSSPPGPPLDDEQRLDRATLHLASAIDELAEALTSGRVLTEASVNERQNFAKYLTIAKIKLENAIAVVRASQPRESVQRGEPRVEERRP